MWRFYVTSILAISTLWPTLADAQTPPIVSTPAPQGDVQKRPDTAIAEALIANPITAPYRLTITLRNGRIILQGRVGSKSVHDVVVQTAIPFGLSLSDELVIDTTAGYQAVMLAPQPPVLVNSYRYPPALFGRFDDPFFGLEPPLITYPAWWPALSDRRLQQLEHAAVVQSNPSPLPPKTIEMTIDRRGVATIRGVVPTEADKLDIGQRLVQTPGIVQLVNRLTVGPVGTSLAAPHPVVYHDQPPPPPVPASIEPRPDPVEPVGNPIRPAMSPVMRAQPVRAVGDGLLARVDRSIQSRAEIGGGVKVTTREGVATLSGSVSSVYEAMLAFRAVQQTPGVKDVVDTLQFVVPDGTEPNPLVMRAKPEDVEPYLEAQIRRQVGDLAHIDRTRLAGVQLQVIGTLERADDRPRVEAILRSMPILRGFTLLPEFRAN